MAKLLANNFRFRKNFSKIKKVTDIPNLIDIQKRSYENFLQANSKPEERKDSGLQGVFKSVFPIKDFNETASLEFVSYTLDSPKYDVTECHQRGMTFAAPLKVTVRLVVWDTSETGSLQNIRDVKEQEVYFGEIPLMTDNGTFIVNGTERVVVSQLHRSPGAFFDQAKAKVSTGGRMQYSARVIPSRGSWLELEFDHRDLLYVRVDRRRKFPVTILLRALGFTEEELLKYFYKSEEIKINDGNKLTKKIELELLPGQKACKDIRDPKSNELLVKKGKKFTRFSIKRIENSNLKEIPCELEDLIGRATPQDIVNPKTGEVILQCNKELTEQVFENIKKAGFKNFSLMYIDNVNVSSVIRDTLLMDKVNNSNDAILEIYSRLRPGDPPTLETATSFFENLFYNPERYDLSEVGRLKMNHKFGLDTPLDKRILTKEDLMSVVRYLIELKNGKGVIDDIDHLGNRRVRAVGELVEIHFRVGLVRMERAIKERMSLQEVDTLMPHELINAKPVSAAIKEFFGSSQLSQFMDQTNPLSEITHKRRLSALGPGGLTRERAGFEVRDVHATHYGRICPIETPEGPNIGLISSLSTYARVNDFGFIETPYRKVVKGKVTGEVEYYSALEEEKFVIAQANAEIDKKGNFASKLISARRGGDFIMVGPEEIDLMDVSPNQLVSVAASLIPFLENDDANRALMGSNMQRQAVPLLCTEAPLVGTGMEQIVAKDSGVTLIARNSGVVDTVDASRIVIKVDSGSKRKSGAEVDIYNLIKYQRSNQTTCINQRPIVKKGDYVEAGEIIADGPSTDRGELALGRNVLVAFMPWGGYNFEDSILLSERLVKEDVLTSIHIEEFEVVARDTKLGREEITMDIPNVGEEALKDLDESGIIRIGAEVKPGDILVGKVTPKGETQLSPEEKLLRAIFGDKAGDVKDTSLRVPPGVGGFIIGAKVFSREGVEKDTRAKDIEDQDATKLLKDQEDEIKIIRDSAFDRIRELLLNKTTSSKLSDDKGRVLIAKGKKITREVLEEIPKRFWSEISVEKGDKIEKEINSVMDNVSEQIDLIKMLFTDKIDKLRRGDELPPGVIKMIKVYVAIKRKISVGDKLAGRHGNKGVVSKILPVEDMPYMEDGTPVDIVLNPLGVPSRMNVGQIFETNLGWAAWEIRKEIGKLAENKEADTLRKLLKKLYSSDDYTKLLDDLNDQNLCKYGTKLSKYGIHMATPVFDGAREENVKEYLDTAGLPNDGQTVLYDGKSGEKFKTKVTVGAMYILKLHHLVDDKIHARSIGPYSLVTQQPLGGKAQFGGQRLGEMEVWALEAYGAAHCLQEFLTVKSDDITGRTRMYEAIVKGENTLEPGIPESFNVLTKELQALGLEVDMMEKKEEEVTQ